LLVYADVTVLTRLLAAVVLPSLLALGALAAPSSAAGPYDQDPDPLRGLLLPPVDALVALLTPVPVPQTPYTGTICVDGADACIDDVITRMADRLATLTPTCSHSAVFSLAYLRVTENVRDAVRSGHFEDRAWLNRLDAIFAEMYFDTVERWSAGRRSGIPAAWRIALEAEDQRSMSGLGNFMLAMNAHINSDFPRVLAAVGLTGPNGSRKRDHNAYNSRLDSLYVPVFTEEAARFDPTFDDLDLGTLDDTLVGVIMRGWREMVWRHAEALVLAKTPTARHLVEKQIELYSTLQAKLIRAAFGADPAQRDAWCAAHG